MFAPTASQMLRDDERLRTLHRQTLKRRNRFLAKQRKLENEEDNRRVMALHKRRELHKSHLPAYRKNRRSAARQAQSATPVQPVRVAPTQAPIVLADPDRHAHTYVDMRTPNRMQSQPKSSRSRTLHYHAQMQKISAAEKKTEFETPAIEHDLDCEKYDEFDNALSDHLSVAELDNFERKHFGIDQSVQYRATQNYSGNTCTLPAKKRNGYQQLFAKKTHYRQQQHEQQQPVPAMQESHSPPPATVPVYATHFMRTQLTASMHGSLFNINDADMKTPEDNDSVKIDPKDSIDCGGKVSLSTMYNSNLLPLYSVASGHPPKQSRKKPKNAHFHQYTSYASNISRDDTRYHRSALQASQVSNANTIQSEKVHFSNSKSYGIKLPRLTQSILKEKDRIDAKQMFSPKSVVSAPVWNNCAMQRKRNATTLIDDFFAKTPDDVLVDGNRGCHLNAQSGGLPEIHRSKLRKPTTKLPPKPNGAYSVISDYDILRQEGNLEKSLMRLNARLASLEHNTTSKNHHKQKTNRGQKSTNYMSETKVSIPQKLKVKRSPTFKRNRQRSRWNI